MDYPQDSLPTATINTNNNNNNAVAAAVSAAVNPNVRQPLANPGHPPYPEMIVAAIKSLNRPTGSSRHAIEKHIKHNFKNLPPKLSDSLTKHLRIMKKSRKLIMVKHSYALPNRSVENSFDGGVGDEVTSEKRMVGRPSKRSNFAKRSDEAPEQIMVPFADKDQDVHQSAGIPNGGVKAKPKSLTKRGPVSDEGQANGAVGGSQNLFVSLGLEDARDGESNREGALVGGDRRLEDVARDGLRTGAGNGLPVVTTAENQVGLSGPRKRGGRPRKFVAASTPGVSVIQSAASLLPHVEAPVVVPFVQSQSQQQPPPAVGAGVEGLPPPAKRRRGRQPKAVVAQNTVGAQASVPPPMSRPEQSAPAADMDSEMAKAYSALERKFKFLQDSVKETVSTVKPLVTNQTAVAQLVKLDELASVLTL